MPWSVPCDELHSWPSARVASERTGWYPHLPVKIRSSNILGREKRDRHEGNAGRGPPGLGDRPPGHLGAAHSSPTHMATAADRGPGWPRVGMGWGTTQNGQEPQTTSLQPGWAGPGGPTPSITVPQGACPALSSSWPQVAKDTHPCPTRAPGLSPDGTYISVTDMGTDPVPKKLWVGCKRPGLSPHHSHAG